MIERLSPLESVMWRVGRDPLLRMTVGVLLVLDRPVKDAALIDRVVAATTRSPRLHSRPDDPATGRVRPMWLEDELATAEQHVRSVEVPGPGSMRQVLDLVALLEPIPFDPERSPWDITLIHGLEGDGSALYIRAHHVLTDGLGGVRLLDELLDHPDRAPVEPKPARRRGRDRGDDGDRPARDWATVTIDLRDVLGTVATGVNRARDAQPVNTVARGVQRVLDLASSVSRQVLVTGGPLAPVPPTHSVLSHFDALRAPHARATALALGGGRTDVLVTAAAAALGMYHEREGVACPEVRVAVPARLPRDGGDGGNWFAPTRVEIPTAIDHPGRQLGVVTERLAHARHEPAMQVTTALASAVSLLPDRLLVPAVQMQVDQIDLAVTAVPGLRPDAHICGAKVDVAYPLGPRLGAPVNVTAFGNNGGLDVGIVVDPASITNPDVFRECLEDAFAKLAREPV